jgi:AcrR family transcriptional regulator
MKTEKNNDFCSKSIGADNLNTLKKSKGKNPKRGPYRNAERTKKSIQKAVIELLERKKSLEEIAISDIAKEADINRGTFYRHYDNLSDVVNEIEDDLMAEITNAWMSSKKDNDSIRNFVETLTKHLKENENNYKQIVNYIPQYVFNDVKNKYFKEMQNEYFKNRQLTEEDRCHIAIVANGVVAVYLDYFQEKNELTLEEISQYSASLIKKVLPDLI